MTEPEPFVFGGRERDLFITALQRFSDTCESPALTPACPFFERMSYGPSCGEQCHDLLAAHQMDHSLGRRINLGGGIEFVEKPRRHRKGPEPSARPFDAGAIQMHDRDRPTDVRHTVSLIRVLEENLQVPPSMASDVEERRYLVKRCFQELVKRGFEYEDLFELAVHTVSTHMISFLAVETLLLIKPGEEHSATALDEAWQHVRDRIVPDADKNEIGIVRRFFASDPLTRLSAWNRNQTLEELIEWSAPDLAIFDGEAPASRSSSTSRASWILDRFTKTYPTEWRTSSLDLEYGYIRSSVVGCAPAAQMQLRRVDIRMIADEITRRAVASRSTNDEQSLPSIKVNDFKTIAVDHLEAGRYDAAATIYEGICALRPTDVEALNNLGFCLIPTNPRRAIEVLTRSLDLSTITRLRLITTCNVAFAYLRLGALEEAFRWAEKACQTSPEWEAWLWQTAENGSLKLMYFTDVPAYANQLRHQVAAALDGPTG